jgi:tetratricopeptide (TPR) repeat protein
MCEANVTAVLGALRAGAGHIDEGRTLLAHSRTILEDLGSNLPTASAWAPLAMEAEIFAGSWETAEAIGRTSFDELYRRGHSAHASTRAVMLADLLLDMGQLQEAERFADVAESTLAASDVLVQFLSRSTRARLRSRQGDHGEAETLAREAVRIASLTDVLRDRGRAHLALAEVLKAAGNNRESETELAEAQRLWREKGLVALVRNAEQRAATRV